MVNTKKRKAVYIPGEIWDLIQSDSKAKFHGVTHELKDALLSIYGTRLNNNTSTFKKIPLVKEEDDENEF